MNMHRFPGWATLLFVGASVSCGGPIEEPGGEETVSDESATDEPVDHVREAVLVGPFTFEPWRTPPAWVQSPQTCTEYYTSPGNLNANGVAIRDILTDVVKRGRMAAYSFAYGDCLGDAMSNGATFPHSPGLTLGPYCRPTADANCSSGTAANYGWTPDSDPYNPSEFSSLLLVDVRAAQVRRVHALSASNSLIRIGCHKPNVWNGPATQFAVDDNQEEILSFRQDELAGLLVEGADSATASVRAQKRAYFAAVIWHELMHGHGYDHSVDGSNTLLKQVPDIAGACMRQVLLDSNEYVHAPTAQFDCVGFICMPGELPVITTYPGSACTCIPDPAAFTTARVATDRGTPGPMVLDSGGIMFRINGVKIQSFIFGTWVDLFAGGPEQIYAGGNYVFYRKSGNLFRLDGFIWTNLGSAGTQIVIDSLGQAYRRTGGTVARVKPGSTTWTNLTGITAAKVFAGGNRVYATVANGDMYELPLDFIPTWTKVSGPGADFAVDSYGVLYRLKSDLSSVAAFRSNVWVNVGGPATGIIAGNRLFGRNASNQVYEFYPNGTWHFVANTYSAWAAGGARIAIKRSGSWFEYMHNGTHTIF